MILSASFLCPHTTLRAETRMLGILSLRNAVRIFRYSACVEADTQSLVS